MKHLVGLVVLVSLMVSCALEIDTTGSVVNLKVKTPYALIGSNSMARSTSMDNQSRLVFPSTKYLEVQVIQSGSELLNELYPVDFTGSLDPELNIQIENVILDEELTVSAKAWSAYPGDASLFGEGTLTIIPSISGLDAVLDLIPNTQSATNLTWSSGFVSIPSPPSFYPGEVLVYTVTIPADVITFNFNPTSYPGVYFYLQDAYTGEPVFPTLTDRNDLTFTLDEPREMILTIFNLSATTHSYFYFQMQTPGYVS